MSPYADPAKRAEMSANWRKKYPDRHIAVQRLHRAIKRGVLAREDCEVCGAPAEAHHDDYSQPLDVRWLCKQHHEEEHHG